ncbi:MAG: glycoside hydrolase family 127 protein, partial [Anaerolineae bacterium]|nr:glycoside hydrolase family 127 protein [Anaerolineae bacterium]
MAADKWGRLNSVPLQQVRIEGGFWGRRQMINRTVTLPIEYEQAKKTGRIDAWRLEWQPGQPDPPHHFWDSDVAKWIEAAAYSLAVHPDPELERLVDDVIELIAAAQQPDGYLNIHFTVVEPQNRWTNLRDMHELYCAGHLTEAAVAYYQATGKRVLLDVLCRYVDHIDALFGPRPGQRRGYPGHEEIELALVKLYRVTGEGRYLDLARFFVDERGRQPHYFTLEARARGEDPADFHGRAYDYNQSHLPVREQATAEGHAVRAMYLYTGMADVAAETGDDSLVEALQTLWRNVTERRMYVTGGIGSAHTGERFTYDYDLPNDLAYAETCAAIGLVFWAQRMLQLDGDSRYADVMERALYNGVLSGVSLDGERFFYANPLEVDPEVYAGRPDLYGRSSVTPERQEWFGCACCPPNIARLLASLGGYAYSVCEDDQPGVYVHLFMEGEATVNLDGSDVRLRQQTRYPWEGTVLIEVSLERPTAFSLWLRVPNWCRQATIRVNGEPIAVESSLESGYARVQRIWQAGDQVELALAMPVERVEA